MVKLTQTELRRRTFRAVYVPLEEGQVLGDLVKLYGADCRVGVDLGYYDESDTYYIYLDREETDEEYDARIEQLTQLKLENERRNAEARKKRLEAERKTYERLKKKFDKD
jgi:hypothetical protein